MTAYDALVIAPASLAVLVAMAGTYLHFDNRRHASAAAGGSGFGPSARPTKAQYAKLPRVRTPRGDEAYADKTVDTTESDEVAVVLRHGSVVVEEVKIGEFSGGLRRLLKAAEHDVGNATPRGHED